MTDLNTSAEDGWASTVADHLAALREQRPLIHNMTNFVVMNFTANILLAAGASPVMAHAPEEVEDMVSLAGALVLNIGTLDAPCIDAMLAAGRRAVQLGVPVVLDPVGAGATPFRTWMARKIMAELRVAVIRANPSEILALAGSPGHTKGVDSMDGAASALSAARQLAEQTGAVVAVTGETDMVTDGAQTLCVSNGHPMMGHVTGTGCGATAMVAAFLAGHEKTAAARLAATASALAYYGIAGERAAAASQGPGSFVPAFLDALYALTPEEAGRAAAITTQPA